MSNAAAKLDAADLEALRLCATLCWQKRTDLALSDAQIDQVLVAWLAVGTDIEAEAATEVLAARREAERKQVKFDGLLGEGGA